MMFLYEQDKHDYQIRDVAGFIMGPRVCSLRVKQSVLCRRMMTKLLVKVGTCLHRTGNNSEKVVGEYLHLVEEGAVNHNVPEI